MCLIFQFVDCFQLKNGYGFSMFSPQVSEHDSSKGLEPPEIHRKQGFGPIFTNFLAQDGSGVEIDFYGQEERWKLRSVVL